MTTRRLDPQTIAQMPAGREMDALVAEWVMGWTQVEWFRHAVQPILRGRTPLGEIALIYNYSTDPADALRVEDRISKLKIGVRYTAKLVALLDIPIDPYPRHGGMFIIQEESLYHLRRAKPHDICRAALIAVAEALGDSGV